MRCRFLALGMLVAACTTGAFTAAKADVVYNFNITSASGTLVTQNGVPQDGTGFTGFPLTLTFTDAGVTSGEVSGFETASFPPTPTQVSGLSGFVSLATYMDGATVGTLAGSLSLDVVFNSAQVITAETIDFSGTDIDFTINNGVVAFGSDGALNCLASESSGACTATGVFVQVPEPSGAALLIVALLALACVRWGGALRRNKTTYAIMFATIGLTAMPAARAQNLTAALPQNLVARPLPVSGPDPTGLVMRKAVLLMRHGVRPPTSTSKFQVYAAQPLPTNTAWGAPDGNLTPNGALLAQVVGALDRSIYSARGLISASGCPAAGDAFVWSDNADQRTIATGNALVTGLYYGCGLSGSTSSSTTADPLFSPTFTSNTTAATAAILARMGGSLATLNASIAPLFTAIGNVLQCCSVTLCAQNNLTAGCHFGDLPSSLTVSSGALSLNGPLGTGSSISEIFELEYANGFTGSNFGFGLLNQTSMTQLQQLYTLKYDYFDRTPILAVNKGSNIAQQMLDAVLQAAGQTTAGPPNAKLTVYVGHDSTQAAIGGMLNLHWALPGFQSDDMPPAGTLGFEVLSDAAGKTFYVRPIYLTLTLGAMAAGVPKAYYQPPIYESIQLPGCDLDSGRLCTLQAFVTLMTAAIDPNQTAPMVYQ
jgi:4-phytase/acid phosphatase